MLYLPASRSGNRNEPSPPVTVSRVPFVPTFLIATVAPGSTPPPESVTTPEICPVNPWAPTGPSAPLTPINSATAKTSLQKILTMASSVHTALALKRGFPHMPGGDFVPPGPAPFSAPLTLSESVGGGYARVTAQSTNA